MAYYALGDIGFARQAAKGTAAGTAWHFLPLMTDSAGVDAQWKEYYTGLNRGQQDTQLVGLNGKGDATFLATLNSLGYVFCQALGGADTVGTVSPYVHTMALGTADLPWVTVHRYFAGPAVGYHDLNAKIDQIDLDAKSRDQVTAKVSWLALQPRVAASLPTVTFDSEAPLLSANAAMTVQQGTVAITGVVENWSLSFKNNLALVPAVGTLIPADLVAGVRKVTGKLNVTWEAGDNFFNTVYGLANNATPSGTRDTGSFAGTISSSTAGYQLVLSLPKVVYTVAKPVLDRTGKPLYIPVDFEAVVNSGNDEISVVVKDGDAGAYTV